MDAETPTRIIKIRFAPRKMPCSICGAVARRKRIRNRKVRSLAFKETLWLDFQYGEYITKCDCCVSFHSCPKGIDPKAKYDHKVRQAVIDRILVDKLNTSTIQEAMKRDFLLDLSTGYLYDALDYAIRQFDGNAFRAKVLSEFSSTLCVDEIHLGHRVVLIASDPVSDNPIACAIVSSNDAEHMLRFLRNLRNHDFSPETVITDRSPLYPKTIAEVWPEAKHQLCVFHAMAAINAHVLDAVRDVRRRIKRKAWQIRRKMQRNRSYLKIESLRKALDVLNKANMEKLLHYLDRDTKLRFKVRTNNHVERCN